jgi:hypothetical protein
MNLFNASNGHINCLPSKNTGKAVTVFLEALSMQLERKQEVLPQHVLEGTKKGREDIKAG